MTNKLTQASMDVLFAGKVQGSRQRAAFSVVDAGQTISPDSSRCPSRIDVEGSPYYSYPSSSTSHESSTKVEAITTALQAPLPCQQSDTSPTSTLTLHSTATASSLSLSGAFNVLIFGETGVGKSSVINLILGRDAARTSSDAQTCTIHHTYYAIDLDDHRFKLWEVSSAAPNNYFRRLFARWNLKRTYNKMYRDDGVYLLLYCMRNSRAQTALVKDYKFFTHIVGSTMGRVPVAAVVTCLEDHPQDMDGWWKKNEQNLKTKGMEFSKHVCVTSLPEDANASPTLQARRRQSQINIRQLIRDSYQVGRATIIRPTK